MNALGTLADGTPLSLDVDRLIGSHTCIVANAGSGKSGLIRRALETTHGRVQHIVLDVEDEFYTLREGFDYVIAGGDGGDVPATVDGAAALAISALTHGFSLIVQLNDLGPVDAPRFVGKFLEAMIGAPRDLWRPALVVVDEAQRFAPQGGATAATAGVKALTAQGRKRGFSAVLASQRISKIDADVRGDVHNWILGRVGQTLDRNIMADQLGFTKREGVDGFRALEPRSFWGFGPAIASEPVLFRVADVETTPVRPGQAKVVTPPPPEALREILAGLAVVPVAERTKGAKLAAEIDAIAFEQLEADNRRLRLQMRDVIAEREEARSRLGKIYELANWVPNFKDIAASSSLGGDQGEGAREPAAPSPAPKTLRALQSAVTGATVPSPAAVAIADLLDRVNPARLTWAQAAAMTGRKASGGNFNAARKWLRDSGRLIEEGDFIQSSAEAPAGMSRAVAITLWKSVLSNPAPRMIDALVQFDDDDEAACDKAGLGLLLGAVPSGGNFNNGLAQLRRNGLLDMQGDSFRLARPLPGEAA